MSTIPIMCHQCGGRGKVARVSDDLACPTCKTGEHLDLDERTASIDPSDPMPLLPTGTPDQDQDMPTVDPDRVKKVPVPIGSAPYSQDALATPVNASRKTAVSRDIWQADFNRYADALKPWVIEDGDWKGIDPDAPADLVRGYESLMQMGYANGWLGRDASRKEAITYGEGARYSGYSTVEQAIDVALQNIPVMKKVVAEPYWEDYVVLDKGDQGVYGVYKASAWTPQSGSMLPHEAPPPGTIVARVSPDGQVRRVSERVGQRLHPAEARAKAVHRITASVLEANPGLGVREARRLAERTIERYPAVVKTAGAIEKLRQAAEATGKEYTLIDGYRVDFYTAGQFLRLFDALKPEQQAKVADFSMDQWLRFWDKVQDKVTWTIGSITARQFYDRDGNPSEEFVEGGVLDYSTEGTTPVKVQDLQPGAVVRSFDGFSPTHTIQSVEVAPLFGRPRYTVTLADGTRFDKYADDVLHVEASRTAARRTAVAVGDEVSLVQEMGGIERSWYQVPEGDYQGATRGVVERIYEEDGEAKVRALDGRVPGSKWVVSLDRLSAAASRKTAMPNPADLGVKVGDFFYTSWGYDQTNVEFYEVTGLTGASVRVREVAQEVDSTYSDSHGSDRVKPRKGDYIGPEMTKRLLNSDRPTIKITESAWGWLWDGTPKYRTSTGWGH